MADTELRVNVTGTNDIAELDRRYKQFIATSKLTSRELVQQAVKTRSAKAIFRDYGQQVRDTQNRVIGYTDVLQNAQVVQNQYGVVASKATRQMKRFGAVGMQQVGYQVGDFLVQIQSGTSAMVAFGQQGSQLAGIFGPQGAVLGAVIAAGTALGNVFVNARKKLEEDATKILGDFEKVQEGIQELSEEVSKFNKVSNLEFGGFLLGESDIGLLSEEINLRKQLLDVERARLQLKVEQARSEVETRREAIDALFEEARISYEIATQNAQTDIERRSALEAYKAATRDIISNNKELFLTQREQSAELRLMENTLKQTAAETEENVKKAVEFENTIKRVNALGQETSGIISAINFMNPISGSNTLIGLLQQAVGLASQIAGFLGMGGGAGGSLIEGAKARLGQFYNFMEDNYDRIMYENQIGRGRSMGQGGPSAEDMRNTVAGQVAAMQNFVPEGSSGGGGGGGGGGSPTETDLEILQQWIADQEKRLAQEESLIGLSEEARRQREIETELTNQLGELDGSVTQKQIENAAAVVAAKEKVTEKMKEQEERMQSIKNTIESELEGAFMSIIDGSKSAGEAFKDMIMAILKEVFRLVVVKPLVSGIMSLFGFGDGGIFSGGSVTASALGNVFKGGNLVPFASGGVVGGPTVFPMKNGNIGLMGEAGPEAIMPLSRDKSGKLGVKVNGYKNTDPRARDKAPKQENIVVNQTYNFAANGDESVKRIIQQETPRIANYTKSAIEEERLRGGKVSRAFR